MKRHFIIFSMALLFSLASGVSAQTASPTPDGVTPDPVQELNSIPIIAADYRSDDRLLPDLERAGVDMAQQKTLTMREAIELALENNSDISISRKSVSIAEFDLKAARGFYQTRLTGESYYESATTPNLSVFTNNPKTTQGGFVANAGLQGYLPKFGTVLMATLNNQRFNTNNPISV